MKGYRNERKGMKGYKTERKCLKGCRIYRKGMKGKVKKIWKKGIKERYERINDWKKMCESMKGKV